MDILVGRGFQIIITVGKWNFTFSSIIKKQFRGELVSFSCICWPEFLIIKVVSPIQGTRAHRNWWLYSSYLSRSRRVISCRTLTPRHDLKNCMQIFHSSSVFLLPCVFAPVCKETLEIGLQDCWISGNWRSLPLRKVLKRSVLRRSEMRLLLTLPECQEGSGTIYPLYPHCWNVGHNITVSERGFFWISKC